MECRYVRGKGGRTECMKDKVARIISGMKRRHRRREFQGRQGGREGGKVDIIPFCYVGHMKSFSQ